MIYSSRLRLEVETDQTIVTIRVCSLEPFPKEKVAQKVVKYGMINILIKSNHIATDFKGLPYYKKEFPSSKFPVAMSSYLFPSTQLADNFTKKLEKSLHLK